MHAFFGCRIYWISFPFTLTIFFYFVTVFFSEVIDSLTRGFEDKLQCDNLILEINSSRYAYNVTLKEVHLQIPP